MTDKYAELRAALDAISPGNGDSMLAYRLASDPKTIRALLAERDTLRGHLEWAVAHIDVLGGNNKILRAALAQEQGGSDGNR